MIEGKQRKVASKSRLLAITQELFSKEYDYPISKEEASDIIHNLMAYTKVLIEIDKSINKTCQKEESSYEL